MKKSIVSALKYFGLKSFVKKLYRMVNFTNMVTVNGKRFVIPHIYGSSFKVDETWMITVLKDLFTIKKGTFIDVGVNLGQTLLEVKCIDPKKKYFGFEPNPACVFYVEELKRHNNFSDCTIVPVGLFSTDTILCLDLYADEITNSGGSVIKNFWEYKNWKVKRQLFVPVFSFNTVCKDINIADIDIIKIDVEGAELEVLTTLSDEILKSKPIILIEILSAYSVENRLRYDRQNKIEDLLIRLEYKMLRLIENKDSTLKAMEKIQSFDVNADPNNCNYIMYHKNDEEAISNVFKVYI